MVLRTLRPQLGRVDQRTARPTPKSAAAIYLTPEHEAWRNAVISRAGGRCEWVDDGIRCTKAEPNHRMFADHIVELEDGGAPFDPANGQCLCGGHHTRKTAKARARRMAARHAQ